MEEAIKYLEKGNDQPIREIYCQAISKVIHRSYQGEIGWGGFIQEIRSLLNGMESTCNKHWEEFLDKDGNL